MTDRGQRIRMAVVVLILALSWVGISFRLCMLHLGENAHLQIRISDVRTTEEKILVGRGRIFDARGHIFAMDLAVKNVCIDPQVITSSNGMTERVVSKLAEVLKIAPAMIAAKVELPGRRYEVIQKNVPVDIAESLNQSGLKGLLFEDVSHRYYPRGVLGCHVLGFSNTEGVGSAGIEQRMDGYLRGVPGLRVSELDGKRRELYSHRVMEIQPQAGDDIYLTIDQNIQYFTEQALDKAMEKNHAKGAWAIVERVKTGEIIAMASRPGYDLNDYGKVDATSRLNRAIGYCYEPGSTFKMASIAAALDAGTVHADQVIDCENGVWIYAGRPLRDFHPHGRLSVGDILKVSSNIGAGKIGLTLGPKRLRDYLASFGVGERTGISLAGEESGILHPVERWSALSITHVPMGHEVMVTSLQILGILNAIGNDGFLVKPQLVQKIVTPQGSILYQRQTQVLSRPIRAETAKLMRKLLTRVCEKGGTGVKANIEGYTVAGKTGTAQKIINGTYSDSANIASFCGLVPAEKPELAMIVVVDEPSNPGEHTGGVVCGPVFKEVMQQAVRYLDVPAVPAELAYHFGDEVPVQ